MIILSQIIDPGIPNDERISLNVTTPDNVGKYVAFLTSETAPGRIKSKPMDTYWFPDQEVNTGDIIILYTRIGVSYNINNQLGTKTFFYFWGQPNTIFTKSKDAVAILKIDSWSFKALP